MALLLASGPLATGWCQARWPMPAPKLKWRAGRLCAQVQDDFAFGSADDDFLDEFEQQLLTAASRGRPASRTRRTSSTQRVSSRRSRRLGGPSLLDARRGLVIAVNEYAMTPGKLFLLGTLFMLLGFYFAHFIDCVFGQSGYWETFAGFVCLFLSENVTREYYTTPPDDRAPLLKLTNSFKVGLYYGLILDAIKMGG
eukprot:scaffold151954_cov31-Tisochrysis_lutea.AAC.1